MPKYQFNPPVKKSKIKTQLNHLAVASREDLAELWVKQYKHPPPKGIRRGLLERAASYKLQSKRLGGLSPKTHRALIAAACSCQVKQTAPSPTLDSGIKLFREWHGKTHQVEVIDKGFVWNGQTYNSLSAIAKAITGAKWSGPRFFGIRP